MRKRSQQIQHELTNLIATAASCAHSPALIEAINNREQEQEQITRYLRSTQGNPATTDIEEIRGFVARSLANIHQLLSIDTQRAKAELAKHITEIRMHPQFSKKSKYYSAEGNWDVWEGHAPKAQLGCVQMVAGARFELATFGL